MSGVDIPSDVFAAALKWHNVQRQRQEKKDAAEYNGIVMGRKQLSRKDKRKYNQEYGKEQERQNERKLLVQKWVWEEHVNQQEVFQATMRIDRDEQDWNEDEHDLWPLSDPIKEVLSDLKHWPFADRWDYWDFDAKANGYILRETEQAHILVQRLTEDMPSPTFFERVVRPQWMEWLRKQKPGEDDTQKRYLEVRLQQKPCHECQMDLVQSCFFEDQ